MVGGPAVGRAATLLRFYGWHALGLPLAAAALMVWHLWRIRRDGGMALAPGRLPARRPKWRRARAC